MDADDKQGESRAFSRNDIKEMIAALPESGTLTKREYEVLTLILEGKKRNEIAESLFLSISAIKKYTTSLYAKMGVKDRIELLAKITTK